MSPRLIPALAATALLLAAGPGCGFGPGESSGGEATLAVSRDYGREQLLTATLPDPPQSETVMRALDDEAEITTRYGGDFVQSIDGIAGELADGRSRDWFFYVNGIESATGASEVAVRAGDRVWWDYRDWTDALRVPAVVGSWPEPFAQVSAGAERLPVRIECAGPRGPCDAVAERLSEEGVDASIEASRRGGGSPEAEALRLLVGPWAEIRDDPVAGRLGEGPSSSGVFARFEPAGGRYELVALDERGGEAARLGPGAGLVAGLREGEEPVSWLVTGTDEDGVETALTMLDEDHLADRYAVVADDASELPVPAEAAE